MAFPALNSAPLARTAQIITPSREPKHRFLPVLKAIAITPALLQMPALILRSLNADFFLKYTFRNPSSAQRRYVECFMGISSLSPTPFSIRSSLFVQESFTARKTFAAMVSCQNQSASSSLLGTDSPG
jgi:hypothetical protein